LGKPFRTFVNRADAVKTTLAVFDVRPDCEKKSVSLVYRYVWTNSQGRGKTSLRRTSMGNRRGGTWWVGKALTARARPRVCSSWGRKSPEACSRVSRRSRRRNAPGTSHWLSPKTAKAGPLRNTRRLCCASATSQGQRKTPRPSRRNRRACRVFSRRKCPWSFARKMSVSVLYGQTVVRDLGKATRTSSVALASTNIPAPCVLDAMRFPVCPPLECAPSAKKPSPSSVLRPPCPREAPAPHDMAPESLSTPLPYASTCPPVIFFCPNRGPFYSNIPSCVLPSAPARPPSW
jgi:hypothetical protein